MRMVLLGFKKDRVRWEIGGWSIVLRAPQTERETLVQQQLVYQLHGELQAKMRRYGEYVYGWAYSSGGPGFTVVR